MIVFPAIDLMGGKCVRLTRGDFSSSTVYSGDPVQTALEFEEAGATFLHIVDLDAAKTGVPSNEAAISGILERTGLRVQVGGGIRTLQAAESRLAAGAERIVVGTQAVLDPGFLTALCERHPGKAVVALDCLGMEIRVGGWASRSGHNVLDFLDTIEGWPVAGVLATDIDRDGMLSGPSIAFYEALLPRTAHPLLASGGVRSAEDVAVLAGMGMAGVVIGKALYEGRLDLAKIFQVVADAS
jgi:phosphoribosylformimino-5-aminoimidazole carboxamide ribotide isomerase